MKFISPLIAVKDVGVSKAFYKDVLFQNVTLDLGTNVSFENAAFAIQQDYAGLVGNIDVSIDTLTNDHEMILKRLTLTDLSNTCLNFQR